MHSVLGLSQESLQEQCPALSSVAFGAPLKVLFRASLHADDRTAHHRKAETMTSNSRDGRGGSKLVSRWFLYSTPVFVAILLILGQWIGWGYAVAIVLVLALAIDIPLALSARKRRGNIG